jgi:hypothetical protein
MSQTPKLISEAFERAQSEALQYLGVLSVLAQTLSEAPYRCHVTLAVILAWQTSLGLDRVDSKAPPLTRRAELFGLVDELKSLTDVQSALHVAVRFGPILQSETSVSSRIGAIARSLTRLRTAMRTHGESDTLPTTAETNAFAARKRWELKSSIFEQQAKIYILKGLVTRGRNHSLLHAKEKAATRRKTAKAVKRLEELKTDLNRWCLGYDTHLDQDPPQLQIPLELQLSVVSSYENIRRRIEELSICEAEMVSFSETCSSIALNLALEAAELRESGGLAACGRAVVLVRAAAERENWAVLARETKVVTSASASSDIESGLQRIFLLPLAWA